MDESEVHLSFSPSGMKHFSLTLLIISTLFITLVTPPGGLEKAEAEVRPMKKVLLLNSYSYDHEWTRQITEAVSDFFAADDGIELVIEFMDSKRHHSPDYFVSLFQLYKGKYRGTDFDAVVTADDNATNFVLDHRPDLFTDVPVIFCGVNNVDLPKRRDFVNITGVLEIPAITETLELMVRLHPGLRKVYVVNEPLTFSGEKDRENIEHSLSLFADRFTPVWLEGLTDRRMQETLAGLSGDSCVLLLSFFPEKEKKVFTIAEGARFISTSSPRPVYSMWEYFLGQGIVGGKLISGSFQGRTAAEIARRVLNGESPESIPVVSSTANRFMFDYQQLKKFNIDASKLPDESSIIHKPFSVMKEYRLQLFVVVAVFVLLSAVTCFLALTLRAKNTAEKTLQSVNDRLKDLLTQRENELGLLRSTEQALTQSREATETAHVKLQSSMRNLRVLLESIPDLVWLKDKDGFYLFCNERFERLFGAVERDIVGKTDYDFVNRDLADFFRDRDQDAMAAGRPVINEETLTFAGDGHSEIVETIKTPVYNDQGKIIGVLGIARNITERKQISEALKESELRFKALHDASFGGILIHDHGKILDCNQGMLDICGYTREELLELRGDLLVAEPYRKMVIDHTRSGHEQMYTAVGLRKNGEEYPVQINGKEIPFRGKTVRVAEFRDITQQKDDEEKIKDSERRHRIIFENSPLGMLRIGADGRILDCNEKFVQLMGSSKKALLGFDILHRAGAESFRNAVERARHGEPASFEDFYTSVTGNKTVYLYVRLNPVHSGEFPTEVIGSTEDLSFRREAEDQLRRARDAAEVANRTKSEFLANMSHEIRTPLNGIIGVLQLLQDTSQDERQKQYINMAVKASRRLTNLLTDILDLSRIEAGMLPIADSYFTLAEQKDSVMEMFGPIATEKGLQIEFIVDDRLPAALFGDGNRLGQILFNLVGNGLKFTDTGGVTVEAELLQIRENGMIRVLFMVRDTGIGLAEGELSKIFEPFSQVESEYTRRFQGAGLGLSIVRKLVALMGGTLAIDEAEGGGSCFYLSLPFRLPPAGDKLEQETLPGKSVKSQAKTTVLLAEDDGLNLFVIQNLLERQGFNVITARDGAQALKKFAENHVDLVVMDMQMPVMDGVTATKEIRSGKYRRSGAVPIIALTAHTMKQDEARFYEAGIDAYLTKPIDGSSLCVAIEELLEKKS